MSLTFVMKDTSISWKLGDRVPFLTLSRLEQIAADNDEKVFLLSKIKVLYSLFGGLNAINQSVIKTANRDSALVVYGMMFAFDQNRTIDRQTSDKIRL